MMWIVARLWRALVSLSWTFGARLSRPTSSEMLESFFSMIRPVETAYGLIRIGGQGDGGYLVPDDLVGIKECFSPGVSEVANFELEMAARGCYCYLTDYSVDGPPVQNDMFDFEKKFLGSLEDEVFIRLENWIARKGVDGNDAILQMDIEGAEYSVLCDTSLNTLSRFRIIVVEFHFLDCLLERFGYEFIKLTFERLLQRFEIVHIHPNNNILPIKYKGFEIPPCVEVTFLRKDRLQGTVTQPSLRFPNPLDQANVPSKADFALPTCWYDKKATTHRS